MVDVDRLSHALSLMQNALQLLDESKAPAQLGAHLDLAICRLQEEVESNSDRGSVIAEGARLSAGLPN